MRTVLFVPCVRKDKVLLPGQPRLRPRGGTGTFSENEVALLENFPRSRPSSLSRTHGC